MILMVIAISMMIVMTVSMRLAAALGERHSASDCSRSDFFRRRNPEMMQQLKQRRLEAERKRKTRDR
jgi:hypothetical protein